MAISLTRSFVKRLHGAIRQSHKRMESFRDNRVEALNKYVGGRYGNKRDERGAARIFNQIWAAASVYIPNLVTHNPRFRTRSSRRFRREAWMVQEDLNRTAQDLDLAGTLRNIVTDSIFGVGIRKAGYHMGRPMSMGGRRVRRPELFVDRVSLDDYVIDPAARNYSQRTFEGDRYRIPELLPFESSPGAVIRSRPSPDGA